MLCKKIQVAALCVSTSIASASALAEHHGGGHSAGGHSSSGHSMGGGFSGGHSMGMSHGFSESHHHGSVGVGVVLFDGPHHNGHSGGMTPHHNPNGAVQHHNQGNGQPNRGSMANQAPGHQSHTQAGPQILILDVNRGSSHGTAASHIEKAEHDLSAARREFEAGHDKAALKDIGKAMQQALSAAKNEAGEKGAAVLIYEPHHHHASTSTTTSTKPSTSAVSTTSASSHSSRGANGASGQPGQTGGAGGNGTGGGHSSNRLAYLMQAMEDLSNARSALRSGNNAAAENDVKAALQQLHMAVKGNASSSSGSSNSGRGGNQHSTHGVTTVAATSSAAHGPSTSGGQHHNHIHNALEYMHASLRQIKEGNDGRAELDIHSAFVQLNEAVQQQR